VGTLLLRGLQGAGASFTNSHLVQNQKSRYLSSNDKRKSAAQASSKSKTPARRLSASEIRVLLFRVSFFLFLCLEVGVAEGALEF
jgi:hypothetical protein